MNAHGIAPRKLPSEAQVQASEFSLLGGHARSDWTHQHHFQYQHHCPSAAPWSASPPDGGRWRTPYCQRCGSNICNWWRGGAVEIWLSPSVACTTNLMFTTIFFTGILMSFISRSHLTVVTMAVKMATLLEVDFNDFN
uniref:Uncharacterized protein n=1 Tax=Octopus bimaculoides TaxID=37653 RepID=A0A0L8H2W9_OCTBM